MNPRLLPFLLLLSTTACGDVEDHDHDHDHNHGAVTTIVLNFTPDGNGDTLSFRWSDPDSSGTPEVDDILLPDASDHDHHDAQGYTLDVEIWNEAESDPEDVTPEIDELADEHQLFFTGSAVEGPATGTNNGAIIRHAYDDEDAGGLPVGLSNTITTLDWGTGELTVTLRHLPPEDGEDVKVAGLADDVVGGGFESLPGENDIQVTFDIEVE